MKSALLRPEAYFRAPHRFSIGPDEVVARARLAYRRYQDYFQVASEE